MKKFMLYVHLYAGLLAAIFLISLSLSGAVIAFEPELNRAFHPELTQVVAQAHPMNWDVFRAKVEQQSPGWKLVRIYFPDRPNESTYVRLRSVTTHRIHHIYASQYTGAVLGTTENGSNWILKVHDLHVNLLSGKVGNQIVTWATFALLLLAFSGLWLWWPRRLFRWRVPVGTARWNRELHLSVGFWSSVAMLIFAVTGLGLHYQTGKLLKLLDTSRTAHWMPGHGTSIEAMLQTAREALPGATIPRLLLAEKPGDPVFLYQRFPEDKTPAGRSFTTINSRTGAVLSIGSSRTAPLLETALVQYTREIHTGTILGPPTKILVVFLSLLLTVLAISGPFIWINKQRAAARGRKSLERHSSARVKQQAAP